MSPEIDPSIMQDFVTESSELIDQLDADLIALEQSEPGAELGDLLNSIFRAMHTIKGGAGFLNLQEVIRFTHAAEDALNRLRQGDVPVTADLIDVLLRSSDLVRQMIDALAAGQTPPEAPDDLLHALRCLAEGQPEPTASAETPGEPSSCSDSPSGAEGERPAERGASALIPEEPARRSLDLSPEKAALLDHVSVDLRDVSQQIEQCAERLVEQSDRASIGEQLDDLSEGLLKTIDFFELEEMRGLVPLLRRLVDDLTHEDEAVPETVAKQLRIIQDLVERQAESLEAGQILQVTLENVQREVDQLTEQVQSASWSSPSTNTSEAEPDVAAAAPTEKPASPSSEVTSGPQATASEADASEAEPPTRQQSASNNTAPDRGKDAEGRTAEQTIRVEVSRLENLLNLVGQMVLSKNRILGLGRKLHNQDLPQELLEDINSGTNELDRFTRELQVGVMQTRMQPLAKLFDRYPRVIRDTARATGKKINLEVIGKETEVDKGVLELLGDPLVHVLRNSADHGIESPEQRAAAGKPETGTIQLTAEHRGSHVQVAVVDDGKGLDREVIGAKAVSRGLTTEDQLASLSDQDVFEFILEAGFSTADQISDLSGRGVGMDVVRTNVNKMNGSIHIESAIGKGTQIVLQIPLTVAIMPAMAMQVAGETYCVPLQNIVEIIRPSEHTQCVVHDQPVIHLRDQVLPLIDLRHCLGKADDNPAKFALIVNAGGQRAGLLLDRLIGQQDIVIKPLDDPAMQGGPFSGATIQDTGEVALILDVPRLTRRAQSAETKPSRPAA